MKSVRRGRKKAKKTKRQSYRKRNIQRRQYQPQLQQPPYQLQLQQPPYQPQLQQPPYQPQLQQPGILARVGDAALFGFGADIGINAAEGVLGSFSD